MHHLMLPPSSLTSLATLEEGLEPRALPSSLSGSPADLRYPVPLSDPRQALFPSSVLYKKKLTVSNPCLSVLFCTIQLTLMMLRK